MMANLRNRRLREDLRKMFQGLAHLQAISTEGLATGAVAILDPADARDDPGRTFSLALEYNGERPYVIVY